MADHGQARDPAQHHASALAAKVARAEPRGEHLAAHARQLAVQPGFQIIRRYPRPVPPSLEQAHRSAVQNHVHRATQMGPWVPIHAGWYWVVVDRRRPKLRGGCSTVNVTRRGLRLAPAPRSG